MSSTRHYAHILHSGGSRGVPWVHGTHGAPLWRAGFENTMHKRTTYTTLSLVRCYTTLTLELHTSASTVAITHVCQLLYQEFDVHMAYVHVYTTRSMWQMLLPLQLGMLICAISMRALIFPCLTRITSRSAVSATLSGVTPLSLQASNRTTRFKQ